MNHFYRIVRNRATGLWQAVCEIARSTGKPGGAGGGKKSTGGFNRYPVTAVALFLLPLSLQAAPAGGQISVGQGSIQQVGNSTTILQSSQQLAINWQRFGSQAHESIQFKQPSALALALNRVVGGESSQLLGSLTANGQVFIINPNGILFGKGAQVNVGGLVASTRHLSDEDFLNGHYRFAGDTRARIENLGDLRASPGGYIAFIASDITNSGKIDTPHGRTELAAGDRISLQFADRRLLGLSIDQGTLQSQIDNGGVILAEGGIVHITAKGLNELSKAVINHDGIIEATTSALNEKGEIILLADMQHGRTAISGSLRAEGKHPGTDGGFVETSGAQVKVSDSAQVRTKAAGGKTGTWLIDPVDFTIAASGGDISGMVLGSSLNSNDVTIYSSSGSSGTDGDIVVNDPVSWNTNRLTLQAHRNININQPLSGSGGASLRLEYGQGAVAVGNLATYKLNAPLSLPAGSSFSTRLGSDGSDINYTVITALGSAGSMNGTDLQGMAGNLGANYALGANIDASDTSSWNVGAGFAPIGNLLNPFTGRFDGLGHQITALTINRPDENSVGLFGLVRGAEISNIGLSGGSITGKSSIGGLVGLMEDSSISTAYATGAVTGGGSVGGLVGYMSDSSISTAYATGAITGTDTASVGGLVGTQFNISSITDSYATGKVTGGEDASIGGLVGSQYPGGSITSSYATGEAKGVGGGTCVGGLVGWQSGGSITDSYATGKVMGEDNAYVGGLVGYMEDSSSITTAHATGAVTSVGDNAYVGGLVGWQSGGSITTAHATGAVTGGDSAKVGGLVGAQCDNGSLTTAYATGAVTGSDSAVLGGLVGQMENGSSITDAHATGEVTRGAYTGGLVGYMQDSSITTAYATGNVTVGDDRFAGGLVGFQSGSSITTAYATGAATGGSSAWVGGLVGWQNNSSITTAYATGAATGGYWALVGGLVGWQYNSSITTAYATGAATGGDRALVGGLVGGQYESSSITTAYATGAVMGGDDAKVGGLVGHAEKSSISTAYATGAVTGGDNAAVGGLVGTQHVGNITTTYAAGDVAGGAGAFVGGLVGFTEAGVAQTVAGDQNYWRTQAAGVSGCGYIASGDCGGVTGKTEAELKQLITFTDWSIDTVGGQSKTWRLYTGDAYPLLKVFLRPLAVGVTATVSGTAKLYNGLPQSVTVTGETISYPDDVEMDKIHGTAAITVNPSSSKNVGSYAITAEVRNLYSQQDGYDIVSPLIPLGTLSINPAPLTLSSNNVTKVYDGGRAVTGAVAQVTGGTLFAGDTLVGGTFVYTDKNVGAGNKTVTVGGVTVNDGNGGNNYLVSYRNNTSSSITPKPLSITARDQDKQEGDSFTFTGQEFTASGLVSGESIVSATLQSSGAPATAPVGQHDINIQDAVAGPGFDANNYHIDYGKGKFTVSSRPVPPTPEPPTPPTPEPPTPPTPEPQPSPPRSDDGSWATYRQAVQSAIRMQPGQEEETFASTRGGRIILTRIPQSLAWNGIRIIEGSGGEESGGKEWECSSKEQGRTANTLAPAMTDGSDALRWSITCQTRQLPPAERPQSKER